ncbi:MAG TPA: hypothetical protein VK823_08025 [Streptosporangiaceae bacterium]|jgi:hypothetical protein|nr:hypothetical protein [Streptosporangiaceae bacterium]
MGKKAAPAGVALPVDAEPPTPQARLVISLSRAGGTAETHVPPGEARHAVTTGAVVGVTWAAIGGAVWIVQISPRLEILALAELGFALAIAILIALCGRRKGSAEAPMRDI